MHTFNLCGVYSDNYSLVKFMGKVLGAFDTPKISNTYALMKEDKTKPINEHLSPLLYLPSFLLKRAFTFYTNGIF